MGLCRLVVKEILWCFHSKKSIEIFLRLKIHLDVDMGMSCVAFFPNGNNGLIVKGHLETVVIRKFSQASQNMITIINLQQYAYVKIYYLHGD